MREVARNRSDWRQIVGVCLALACLTWLVFGQTLHHAFVNYDDETYVYRNPNVARGITSQGIAWAFTHLLAANWHPVTVLSHMLDCSIYGLHAGGHHFTNVLLHTLGAILLFLFLNHATGALWRSAFVGAVFAVHPLHVESVAWISERKDVLSGFFFMLTLFAYVRYAREPTGSRYIMTFVLLALGLMSKPMLVTVPFVFLLLDYWPLARFEKTDDKKQRTGQWSVVRSLILEKIPFLILSAAISAVAIASQSASQSLAGIKLVSWPSRLANAFVAYAVYVWQMIWPRNLAVFYPHPGNQLPSWQIALAVFFLIAISFAALARRRRYPYLFTGWFWYVGMMVPVIGVIQVGQQAHADRYTYLPQIGLYLAIAWTTADALRSLRHRRMILALATAIILACLVWAGSIQASYWRDSESLWRHAIAVTSENSIANEHLADALLAKNRIDEAIAEARRGLTFQPVTANALSMLGVALTRKGELDESISYLRRAAELDPKLYLLHYNLGNALFQKGEVDEAISEYSRELEAHPDLVEAQNNLGNALLAKGQPDEALVHLKKALEINPNYAEALNNFGIAQSQLGDMAAAVEEWNKTLRIEPNNLNALCNLAWVDSTFPDASIRDGSKAVGFAARALEISGRQNPRIWRLLAAAYAETGRFSEAISAAREGIKLADAQGNYNLARTLEDNIALFQSNSPIRDTTQAIGRSR